MVLPNVPDVRRHKLAPRLLKALSQAAFAMTAGLSVAQTNDLPTGGIRVFRDTNALNPNSPGAAARRFDPTAAPGSSSYTGAELIVGGKVGGLKVDTSILALGRGDDRGRSRARFSQLFVTKKVGAFQASGGLRIVDWDVGFGFRPNDMVMMETTRPLTQMSRKGKYLLQLDHFGQVLTTSVVLINPHQLSRSSQSVSMDKESALAGQVYAKVGDIDVYGFGRYGQRSGSSAGAAVVAVPTDSMTVQASARVIRNYAALTSTGATEQIFATTPWATTSRRNTPLATVGGSWAGSSKQTVFLEYWYDGRAPSDAQWADWSQRGQWLRQTADAVRSGLFQIPVPALAGNLAWQEVPFDILNQRRDNVLLRLAWQPEDYAFTFDTVYSPADGGINYTLAAQWRRQALTLNAAVRWLDGPPDSVARQVPTSKAGHMSATWSF